MVWFLLKSSSELKPTYPLSDGKCTINNLLISVSLFCSISLGCFHPVGFWHNRHLRLCWLSLLSGEARNGGSVEWKKEREITRPCVHTNTLLFLEWLAQWWPLRNIALIIRTTIAMSGYNWSPMYTVQQETKSPFLLIPSEQTKKNEDFSLPPPPHLKPHYTHTPLSYYAEGTTTVLRYKTRVRSEKYSGNGSPFLTSPFFFLVEVGEERFCPLYRCWKERFAIFYVERRERKKVKELLCKKRPFFKLKKVEKCFK